MCLNERGGQMDNNAIALMQPFTVYQSFFLIAMYMFFIGWPQMLLLYQSLTLVLASRSAVQTMILYLVYDWLWWYAQPCNGTILSLWLGEHLMFWYLHFPHLSHNKKNNNVERECSIYRLAVRTDVPFKTVLTRTDCSGIFLLSQYAELSVRLWKKKKKNTIIYECYDMCRICWQAWLCRVLH